MKYLLSFLLIILLVSCSSSAGRVAGRLGNQVKQCCASLALDKKPVSLSYSDEGNSLGGAVSVFEIETKLIHTW
jgi:hypothetical protein